MNRTTLLQATRASTTLLVARLYLLQRLVSLLARVDMDSWESSQTTGPYTIHRLGVREIMENTQLPHRIRQGGFYLQTMSMMWPYHLITDDSDDCVIHQLTYQANDSEVSVERFQLNRSPLT